MRYFIDLIENASYQWLDDDPETVRKYIRDWDHRPELGDGDVTPPLAPKIAELQTMFRSMISDGHITGYRAMRLRPDTLEAGCGIGQCWTYEPSMAIAYGGGNGYGMIDITFTASIPASSVDWLATIALNNVGEHGEHEIRVKYNAPVVVTTISDRHGFKIRPDLWGETFRAAGAV